jgi:hypothetical protein
MAPYWGKTCPLCGGHIADSLLECLPPDKFDSPEGKALRMELPGGALACPYCGGLISFDDEGELEAAKSGLPVLRYSRARLHTKMTDANEDNQPPQTPLPEWALNHRFTEPGTHQPLEGYLYAENAPTDETVP